MNTFKNYRNEAVSIATTTGHSIRFEAQQERVVPEILIDACLGRGLVPTDTVQKQLDDQAVITENQALKEQAESDDAAEAKVAAAKALKIASEKADKEAIEASAAAKRSTAAKRAAATRMKNAAAKSKLTTPSQE